MKRLILIIVVTISLIGFTLLNINKVEPALKNNTALIFKYYDNARLYKIDMKNNKFYLIRDFKKKQIV